MTATLVGAVVDGGPTTAAGLDVRGLRAGDDERVGGSLADQQRCADCAGGNVVGFPLEIAMFDGNKAETTTLIPVIQQFQTRHGVDDLVVVADAGMLSAANLNALEDAGWRFIVGSRQSKAPYDLKSHFQTYGNYIPDDSTLEITRDMGSGKDKRSRRVVYHYSFKRHKRADRTINAQMTKAEQVADGKRPIARDRFVTVTTDAEARKPK